MMEFLNRLQAGLMSLGLKRLTAMGVAGLAVFALITGSAYFFSFPKNDVLYSGLDMQDVNQIGAVLSESGIAFDVSADGKSVLVDYGHTANARMILAERGLPKGDKSGYDLFDNLGSMGLTSFMQEVTKVRALEGELARTIQLMNGIKAARVHIVLPQEGSFRSLKEPPSASVMIRTDMNDGKSYAPAVQQLVAAAIPGMTKDMVTVLGTDGTVLASHGDPLLDGPETMVNLEKTLAKDIQERVSLTLAPFLGADSFRVSVSAKLNTDRTQTNETKYDPESRVERSVRTVKELGEAQNKASQSTTSVDQSVPTETAPSASGQLSSEKNDKKEELTNYEINSKSIAVVSEGYRVEKLSVAVLIDKAQVVKALGASATPDQVDKQIAELKLLVSSASGLDLKRGDSLELSAIDFLAQDALIEPVASDGFSTILMKNLGTFINAIALLGVTFLALQFGLKPMLKAIAKEPTGALGQSGMDMPMLNAFGANDPFPALGSDGMGGGMAIGNMAGMGDFQFSGSPGEAEGALMAKQKLEELVASDSEKAAKILRKWLSEPKAKVA